MLTQGHDRSADYWAFGVLVFELLCRHTPFEGRNQQRTFEKIVHSQKHLNFPPGFDPHCKSLIRRLLHPNAALRLGALQNGFDDIRSHAFFVMQNVDFDKLLTQEVAMECRPPLQEVSRRAEIPGNAALNQEISCSSDGDDFDGLFNVLNNIDSSEDFVESC